MKVMHLCYAAIGFAVARWLFKRQSGELLARWDDLQRRDLADFQKLTAQGSLSTVVVPPAGRVGDDPMPAH